MEHKKFISKLHEGEYLDYLYSRPETGEKLPLVFYIHGAGSRGNDLSLLEENSGLAEVIKHVGDKCIIAAPQCHGNYWFDLFEVLCEFVDTMRNSEEADIDRVYITGSSMGGYTTWQLCLSHPDWFAAAAPICGGGMYWAAVRLKTLPIWAFHGAGHRGFAGGNYTHGKLGQPKRRQRQNHNFPKSRPQRVGAGTVYGRNLGMDAGSA